MWPFNNKSDTPVELCILYGTERRRHLWTKWGTPREGNNSEFRGGHIVQIRWCTRCDMIDTRTIVPSWKTDGAQVTKWKG